jgi:hypothetical protein
VYFIYIAVSQGVALGLNLFVLSGRFFVIVKNISKVYFTIRAESPVYFSPTASPRENYSFYIRPVRADYL